MWTTSTSFVFYPSFFLLCALCTRSMATATHQHTKQNALLHYVLSVERQICRRRAHLTIFLQKWRNTPKLQKIKQQDDGKHWTCFEFSAFHFGITKCIRYTRETVLACAFCAKEENSKMRLKENRSSRRVFTPIEMYEMPVRTEPTICRCFFSFGDMRLSAHSNRPGEEFSLSSFWLYTRALMTLRLLNLTSLSFHT